MSLFSSQTIFNLLITLIIGTALYYYMKYKFRILELTQREHAKVLQSVIMSMNTNNSGRGVANQSGGEYISMGNLQNLEEDMNRFNEINKNELIDVSDEDESEDEDSETDSSESSESCDDSSDDSSDDEVDEIDENSNVHNNNNTKKIVITNNHDSHKVEHLTGSDIKVIELTHPLYPNNETVEDKTEYNEDDDDDDECQDESESESDSESSAENEDESHEIKDTVEQKQEQTLEECTNMAIDNSLDNISVTTVFKNKNNDTSVDYNGMTVLALRQMLKTKFVSEGNHMSESSINKLSKKDLIKMLQ
jgi:hypothetical protein